MKTTFSPKNNPRVIIIQKLYGKFYNNDEKLDLVLNTLFFSDGQMSIEQIAQKSNLPEKKIYECSKELVEFNLLEKIRNRISTIYCNHRKINMLPNILSDNYNCLVRNFLF